MPDVRIPRNKTEFTVSEAAEALGVTTEELRSLLVRYVVDDPQSIQNIPRMRFRAADLIMLNTMVAGQQSGSGRDI